MCHIENEGREWDPYTYTHTHTEKTKEKLGMRSHGRKELKFIA